MRQPSKPRAERELTSEQVALLTECVRQRNELGYRKGPDPETGVRQPLDLADFLDDAKKSGFWRMRKLIEETAAAYAKEDAQPVRYIGYPPSPSDPAPLYQSWRDYLDTVSWTKLRRSCLERANQANKRKYHRDGPGKGVLLSSDAKHRVEGYQVWRVMCAAKGRCMHCGSLAVEGIRPNRTWGSIGRRVGSLEHILPLHRGGDNDFANLNWSCLWCNHLDREKERQKGLTAWGALDSCGFHPPLSGEPGPKASEAIVAAKYEATTRLSWKGAKVAFAVREQPYQFVNDDSIEDEIWPDHECPEATAMWQDTFG
jgi:hypothetical protein